jgi:hypothetical protein
MRKSLAAFLLIALAATLYSCGSSNRMGCPGNPTYYRGR